MKHPWIAVAVMVMMVSGKGWSDSLVKTAATGGELSSWTHAGRLGTLAYRHDREITQVLRVPGSGRLLSSGYDSMRLWEPKTGKEIWRRKGRHESLSLSTNGEMGFARKDNEVVLFNVSTGKLIGRTNIAQGQLAIYRVVPMLKSRQVLVGYLPPTRDARDPRKYGQMALWDIMSGEKIWTIPSGKQLFGMGGEVSEHETSLYTSAGKDIVELCVATRGVLRKIRLPDCPESTKGSMAKYKQRVTEMHLLPGGEYLVVGRQTRTAPVLLIHLASETITKIDSGAIKTARVGQPSADGNQIRSEYGIIDLSGDSPVFRRRPSHYDSDRAIVTQCDPPLGYGKKEMHYRAMGNTIVADDIPGHRTYVVSDAAWLNGEARRIVPLFGFRRRPDYLAVWAGERRMPFLYNLRAKAPLPRRQSLWSLSQRSVDLRFYDIHPRGEMLVRRGYQIGRTNLVHRFMDRWMDKKVSKQGERGFLGPDNRAYLATANGTSWVRTDRFTLDAPRSLPPLTYTTTHMKEIRVGPAVWPPQPTRIDPVTTTHTVRYDQLQLSPDRRVLIMKGSGESKRANCSDTALHLWSVLLWGRIGWVDIRQFAAGGRYNHVAFAPNQPGRIWLWRNNPKEINAEKGDRSPGIPDLPNRLELWEIPLLARSPSLGKEALQSAVQRLGSDTHGVRCRAQAELVRLSKEDAAILKTIQSTDPEVRVQIAIALKRHTERLAAIDRQSGPRGYLMDLANADKTLLDDGVRSALIRAASSHKGVRKEAIGELLTMSDPEMAALERLGKSKDPVVSEKNIHAFRKSLAVFGEQKLLVRTLASTELPRMTTVFAAHPDGTHWTSGHRRVLTFGVVKGNSLNITQTITLPSPVVSLTYSHGGQLLAGTAAGTVEIYTLRKPQ